MHAAVESKQGPSARDNPLAFLSTSIPSPSESQIHSSYNVVVIQIPDDLASDPIKARRRGSSLVAAMKELASVMTWTQRQDVWKEPRTDDDPRISR
jgi:hypothetical protein